MVEFFFTKLSGNLTGDRTQDLWIWSRPPYQLLHRAGRFQAQKFWFMKLSGLHPHISYNEIFGLEIFLPNGVVGKVVDFRSKGPGFNPQSGFLKVWWKKFLTWKDFHLWFSWTLRLEISWFEHSSAWNPMDFTESNPFCGNLFWRGVTWNPCP